MGKDNTANLRSYLEEPYFDNRTNINQNNAILVLYQIFIQLMDFKFMNIDNKHYFSFEFYDLKKESQEKMNHWNNKFNTWQVSKKDNLKTKFFNKKKRFCKTIY